jgi:hypothetical protein
VISRRIVLLLAALLALVLVAPRVAAAQQLDVIRGQVTGDDDDPIENANITATSVAGGVNRTARTDRNGRFTITFPGGDGDYFITVASLGYTPRRFEVRRTADQDILVADVQLSRMVILDTVRAVAERDRVNRNERTPDVSGTEQAAAGNAAVAADQQGDLNAIAATIPGVTPVLSAEGDPAGFSVLGLSADQNSMTLNGANLGSSTLPRDAQVSTSLVTAPYDVSRGGFSGGQLNVRSGSGTNFIRRNNSLNFDAPSLQWTDPAARALGQQYTNVSLGGSLSGPIVFDKAFYNLAYQLGRRANDLRTLLNTDPAGMEATGVSADSVARLLAIAQAQGIPLGAGVVRSSRLRDNGSLFGTFDYTPPSSTTGTTYKLVLNGNWNRQTPAGNLASELPAHSGARTNWGLGAQLAHTSYVKQILLSETTLSIGGNKNYGSPYTLLPNGSVLVNSTFDDGTSGVRTLAFGGSSNLSTSSTGLTTELQNQLSWFSRNNKHRLKLSSELQYDDYGQDQTTNLLGTFGYNSLADLAANRPAFYTRSLSNRIRNASALTGALAIGDSYRRTSNLQIQYGLRFDANRFNTTPTYNSDVEQVFRARNDVTPNKLYVSPRIGFSWTYGTAQQIAAFEGAVRNPRAVVRGGIGVFQSTPNANLIGNAVDNTGLTSAVQQLSCVGSAVPIPDWGTYASDPSAVPTQCADGSLGTVFASNVPNVNLFAKDFQSPRSIRSNVNWSGPILGNRLAANWDITYSVNLNQSSNYDLNFQPTQRFALTDEAGRPVYVQPGSIVPATGAIASRDARVSQAYNRVQELRSDLRSETKQLRVGISPQTFSQRYNWSINYTLADVREQYRGFQSTTGNPRDIGWSRSGGESRHQITYNLFYNFFDAVRVNWFGQVRSGTPFTPGIAGDVNGDGYSNDRAFIYDPATTADPALAATMKNLIDNSTGSARECLVAQLGKLAERNSCRGPWTTSANLNISFNPLKVRLPQRATLSFSVSNPLGAADLLLHGQSKLHGWGQTTFADPTLMYVRGFDSTAQRFRYEVNPRFGSSNPQFNAFRAPVTLTMQVRVDVGPSRERQQLTQMLDRGRKQPGQKIPEQALRAQYGSGGLLNPMAQLLRSMDTLGLVGWQADSIATMNRRYTIRLDSIWSPVARYLAALPEHYDQGEAYDRYTTARKATVDMLMAYAPAITLVLRAEHMRKLPWLVACYLFTGYLAGIRSGTVGGGAGGAFGGFGGGGFGRGGGGGGGGFGRGG